MMIISASMVMNMSNKIKLCPLLIGYEEHNGCFQGDGMFRKPIMCPCIKDDCVAYCDGFCKQFKQSVKKIDGDEHGN